MVTTWIFYIQCIVSKNRLFIWNMDLYLWMVMPNRPVTKTWKVVQCLNFAGKSQTWQPMREDEEEKEKTNAVMNLMWKAFIWHLPGQGFQESACYSLTLWLEGWSSPSLLWPVLCLDFSMGGGPEDATLFHYGEVLQSSTPGRGKKNYSMKLTGKWS